jgi:hypothetical protein
MIDRLEAEALQRWIDLDWVRPQRDGASIFVLMHWTWLAPVSYASFITSCGSRKITCP